MLDLSSIEANSIINECGEKRSLQLLKSCFHELFNSALKASIKARK